MSRDEEISEAVTDAVNAGMLLLEVMQPMLDTLEGYRRECESRGYTPEEARRMAIDLHYMITHNVGNSNGSDS